MSGTESLRALLVGLVRMAACEEELLLMGHASARGAATRWGALPTVEHNARFKDEQIARLRAIREGVEPPGAVEVDHRSPDVYRRLAAVSASAVRRHHRRTTDALVDAVGQVSHEDLLDPARHPWLRGRPLWLQVVVRGFWHPLGHVGDFYVEHGSAARAIGLHAFALHAAEHFHAPDPVLGMAHYSLACAQARGGLSSEALASLRRAVSANSDLRANATRDPDLESLELASVLGATGP